ncbi:MAG TPA: ABC transporter substrate-binding protein/permease [Polyangiaceae bacterium]|jgi:polar amino acid transport system substrate-binding protein|nr:ABC transporter substrate-binding protein/permease [Polyangiaceae bacterium]
MRGARARAISSRRLLGGVALAALVFACLAFIAAAPAARADTLDAVRARGELVWGGDIQGGEPYVFEDPKDPSHLVGFEVEIAAALAREMGLRGARFAEVQWSNLVPSLERGDVDVALNGLEDTPERRARLRLSRPYFVFHEVLAVHQGAPFRSLEDLRGKRVGTLNQTYALELLQRLPRDRAVDIALYEGQEEPYYDLQVGRVDGVFLDHIIAARYGCPLAGVACLPGDQTRGTYVIGMRPDDARLAGAIDAALGRVIASGELRRILEAWRLWDDAQAALATAADAPEDARASAPLPSSGRSLTSGQVALFFQGATVTIALSVASFALAVPLGVLLAAARMGGGSLARALAAAYVEVLRGTPVLLQLYVLYYGLAPVLRLGPITAATLGLGLNYAAYEAEVYRGALMAIPRGQTEAAAALGFGPWQTLRHVMLPQAVRTALPAVTNDFVSLLKDSSLVSVLTVVELTKRMTIAAVEVRSWIVPGLLCAALYFAMSFPLSRLSRHLERRLENDPRPRPL